MYTIYFYVRGRLFTTRHVDGYITPHVIVLANVTREIRSLVSTFRGKVTYRVFRNGQDITQWFEG